MKLLYAIPLLAIFCTHVKAQIAIPAKMINHQSAFKIDLIIKENGDFEYKISNANKPDEPITFVLSENESTAFNLAFKKAIELEATNLGFKSSSDPEIDREADRLFYYFKAGEMLRDDLSDNPIAGYLDFNNRIANVYNISENPWIIRAQIRDSIRTYKKNAKKIDKLKEAQNEKKTMDYAISELEKSIHKNSKYTEYCKCLQSLQSLRENLKNANDSVSRIDSVLKSFDKYSRFLSRNEYMRERQDVNNALSTKRHARDSIGKIAVAQQKRAMNLKAELMDRFKLPVPELDTCQKIGNQIRSHKDSHKEKTVALQKIETRIVKYSRTDKANLRVPPFKRRWFLYNGNKYSRYDLKVILEDQIPQHNDSIRSKLKPYYTYLNKIRDPLLSHVEIIKKSNRLIFELNQTINRTKIIADSLNKKVLLDSTSYFKLITDLKNKERDQHGAPQLSWNKFENNIPSPLLIDFRYWLTDQVEYWKDYYAYTFPKDSAFYGNQIKKIDADMIRLKGQKGVMDTLTASRATYRERFDDLLFHANRARFIINNITGIERLGKTYGASYANYKPIKEISDRAVASLDSVQKVRKKVIDLINPKKDSLLNLIAPSYDPTFNKQQLKISNIEVEINEGLIENIYVTGRLGNSYKYINRAYEFRDTLILAQGGEIKLENRHPFGFSRKVDYENLQNKYLFTIDNHLIYYKLYVKDILLGYVQRHEINRRDFSPEDIVLRVAGNTSPTKQTLYKGETHKLFEAKVFSDFVGLDKSNPNGLIQTEIDKRINIRTIRQPLGRREFFNVGRLSYITPFVAISKLEENNKHLLLKVLDDTVNGVYSPKKFISTLELRRHENFSAGFDLNLLLIDIPTGKSTLLADAGFRYGRVSIIDSIKTNVSGTIIKSPLNYSVNTFRAYPKIGWVINSDGRYTFYFECGFNFYWLRDNRFKQVANEDIYQSSFYDGMTARRQYTNLLFQFAYKTGTDKKTSKGKLFFRYQYNYQWKYFNTGFHQAQVGYSFYLLGNQ